jgi:hypothetical protein
VINIDELIGLLELKIVWQSPEGAAQKITNILKNLILLYLFGGLLKNSLYSPPRCIPHLKSVSRSGV